MPTQSRKPPYQQANSDPKMAEKIDEAFPLSSPDTASQPPPLPDILSGAVSSDGYLAGGPVFAGRERLTILPDGMPTVEHFRNVHTQLADFQAELPRIEPTEKGQVPGGREHRYAGLDSLSLAVLRLLGKHGLAWVTKPTVVTDESGRSSFALEYKLVHGESGTSETGVWPLVTGTGNPQATGSAITYARRYCLMAVTGVFPGGEDDDGSAAGAETARRATSGRQVQEEMPGLRRSVERAGERQRQRASQQKAEAPQASAPAEPPRPVTTLKGLRVAIGDMLQAPDFPPPARLREVALDLGAAIPSDLDEAIGLPAPGKTIRQAWTHLLCECATGADSEDMLSTVAKAANHFGVFDQVKPLLSARKKWLADGGPAGRPTPPAMNGNDAHQEKIEAELTGHDVDAPPWPVENFDGEPPY